MRKEHKVNIAKWIKALRSKKYTQTKSHLKDSKGYCCLGVACDISGLGTWTKTEHGYMSFKPENEFAASSSLPVVVSEWLGLNESNPALADRKGDYSGFVDHIDAIEANDELGWSFKKIANALEKKYLKGTTANEVLKNA